MPQGDTFWKFKDAWDAYGLRPHDDSILSPRRARRVINILSKSRNSYDWLHAGWAAIELAHHPETDSHESTQLLDRARAAWQYAAEADSAKPRTKIRAKTALAYIPTFQETMDSDDPHAALDWTGLLGRLKLVNFEAIAITQEAKTSEHDGSVLAALELASVTYVTRLGSKAASRSKRKGHPPLRAIPTARPAASWQEFRRDPTTGNLDQSKSFSILFGGPSTDKTGHAKVISFSCNQTARNAGIDKDDRAGQEAYWRQQHSPDTRLLFGNLHLDAKPDNPLAANLALINSDRSDQAERITIITQNIFQALGLTLPI